MRHGAATHDVLLAFEKWLHTLSEQCGGEVEKTADVNATAALKRALETWWSREEHGRASV